MKNCSIKWFQNKLSWLVIYDITLNWKQDIENLLSDVRKSVLKNITKKK